MTDLRKAAKMALEALEFNNPLIEDFGSKEQLKSHNEAIEALYKTLAQLEQEPVAWLYDFYLGGELAKDWTTLDLKHLPETANNIRPLYTAPISEPVKERISEPVENLEPVAWVVRRTTSEGIMVDGVWTCDSDEEGAIPVYALDDGVKND